MVIIGGGFGGLEAAKSLCGARVDITLIDRTNHHLFQPLLYQVAMAAISSVEIAYPIRSIFRGRDNVSVLMAQVDCVDLEHQVVKINNRELGYDYLIVAAGSQNSYFGHDEWSQHAIGLKTLRDAFMIRRQVLLSFETAEKLPANQGEDGLLTFVIIGAGPTGVELAGSLAELSQHVLSKDFRKIRPSDAKIILLEGADRILPTFPDKVSELALTQLTALGVEVRTKTFVTDITELGVQVQDDFIPSVTKLWCAGVAPSPIAATLGVPLERGRIKVQPDLSICDHPNVFAIGDIACCIQDGKPLPGVAPVAVQQGKAVAANIRKKLNGDAVQPFRYIDRGSLATIGRAAAVGSFGKISIGGLLAWWAWVLVHILNLIGFRNRMVVMFDWLWSYMTFQRGARLIVDQGLGAEVDIDRLVDQDSLEFKKAEEKESVTTN